MIDELKLKKILRSVQKPARYCGGEYNQPPKKQAELNFLMCFPDLYEVAMSNLGIKLLYHMINQQDDLNCERCFAPAVDMAEQLRAHDLPLFSIETQTPMADFDLVGFSLQYEMSYSTILYMLDLAGFPYLACERENFPPLIAGGPCACNPMPLNEIFDLFVIGDGEQVTLDLCRLYLTTKKEGKTKDDFLRLASKLNGVYVPKYSVGTVKKAVIQDLDGAFFPTKPLVSNIEAVHDRAVLEIFRGCTRGCRFCQAGFIYRPVRERKHQTLLNQAIELIDNTGYDEIGLSSLSTCDYSSLKELLQDLKQISQQKTVTFSLPSLRLDSFEAQYADLSRLNSITFAPEAGTQRLRDVINKNITEENIISSVNAAFEKGIFKLKLYFMLGLPTETMDDVEGIVQICHKIRAIYKQFKGKKQGLSITVSTSTFIPKPFTPFERCAFDTEQNITQKQQHLRNSLRPIGVKYNWHDYATSKLEAVFARGDQRLNRILISAYKNGAKFDGWSEFFNADYYNEAFKANSLNIDEYLDEFSLEQVMPWQFIDMGIDTNYLINEYKLAILGQTTKDCRQGCNACGLQGDGFCN